MKKLFLFLSVCAYTLSATARCVDLKQVGANYKNRTITFVLTWTGCNNTTNLNKVWCLVDFQSVDAAGNKGSWQRATISGTPSVTNATYTTGNTTGFYVTGVNGRSATVTVKLGNAIGRFNWCAFASDYPPRAVFNNGTYSLKGTPPFTLTTSAGTTVTSGRVAAGCLTAITDATGYPGIAQSCCSSVGAVPTSKKPCCAGLSLIGTTCKDPNGSTVYSFSGCPSEIKNADAGTVNAYEYPNSRCPSGWRWPTLAEAQCMCANRNVIGGFTYSVIASSWYGHRGWSYTDGCTYCGTDTALLGAGGSSCTGDYMIWRTTEMCGNWCSRDFFYYDGSGLVCNASIRCVK